MRWGVKRLPLINERFNRVYFCSIGIDECSDHNGHCIHKCRDLPIGFECYCNHGYKLANDSRSCEGANRVFHNSSRLRKIVTYYCSKLKPVLLHQWFCEHVCFDQIIWQCKHLISLKFFAWLMTVTKNFYHTNFDNVNQNVLPLLFLQIWMNVRRCTVRAVRLV